MLQVDICMNLTAGGHQPLSSTYPPPYPPWFTSMIGSWGHHWVTSRVRELPSGRSPSYPILTLCQSLLRCLRQHVWIIPILQTVSEWVSGLFGENDLDPASEMKTFSSELSRVRHSAMHNKSQHSLTSFWMSGRRGSWPWPRPRAQAGPDLVLAIRSLCHSPVAGGGGIHSVSCHPQYFMMPYETFVWVFSQGGGRCNICICLINVKLWSGLVMKTWIL